ncbi:hypothetical protein Q7P37_001130 [Cladosporium fusiforme]
MADERLEVSGTYCAETPSCATDDTTYDETGHQQPDLLNAANQKNDEAFDNANEISELSPSDLKGKAVVKSTTVHRAVQTPSQTLESSIDSSHHVSSYEAFHISGQASVHCGDSSIVNNYHMPAPGQVERTPEKDEKPIAWVTAAKGVAMIAFLAAQYKMNTMSMEGLAPQMRPRAFEVEDALGNILIMDTLFVSDWKHFTYYLSRYFLNKPGFGRVVRAKYRLFDRNQSEKLINPNQIPRFRRIFRPGMRVAMSVHYEWHELSHEICPRCGLEQQCKPGDETICPRCQFIHRCQVEEIEDRKSGSCARIEEINDRPEGEVTATVPGDFKRITISKQPDASHTRNMATAPQCDVGPDCRDDARVSPSPDPRQRVDGVGQLTFQRAIDIARNAEGDLDPSVTTFLEEAITEISEKLDSDPDSYILSKDEFAVFNYYRHRFSGDVAERAVDRYWRST